MLKENYQLYQGSGYQFLTTLEMDAYLLDGKKERFRE
jgi:hypothetical protein